MSKESMDIIMDKICDELEESAHKIAKQGKMSMAELKEIGELIDIKKNILKTEMLEEADGYSQAGDWEASGRMTGTYGRNYDRGNSYANRGEHWVRGHYSRADRRMRDDRGRYSRADGREFMMEHVDAIIDEAPDERTREAARRFKKMLQDV